jgi:hypothetical protein
MQSCPADECARGGVFPALVRVRVEPLGDVLDPSLRRCKEPATGGAWGRERRVALSATGAPGFGKSRESRFPWIGKPRERQRGVRLYAG